jgi:hypothetical protein
MDENTKPPGGLGLVKVSPLIHPPQQRSQAMSEEAPISQKPNPVHLMLGIIFGLVVIFLPRGLGPDARDGFLQYVFQIISLCLCIYLIGRFVQSRKPKN